ncbi:MAG: hypothetical protein SW833_21960 [Cyanobacteriota bacterium]|nr:hypothetical protein [Cyanobacteriota bacterium]
MTFLFELSDTDFWVNWKSDFRREEEVGALSEMSVQNLSREWGIIKSKRCQTTVDIPERKYCGTPKQITNSDRATFWTNSLNSDDTSIMSPRSPRLPAKKCQPFVAKI